MKTKILFITLLLLIIGCSKEPINEDSLQTRGGLKYEINQTTPYSGPTFMTHENGEISFKGKYKNGIKDGLFEEFYDNGQLKKSVIYNGGTESGESVFYSENGDSIFYQNFDKDSSVIKDKLYFTESDYWKVKSIYYVVTNEMRQELEEEKNEMYSIFANAIEDNRLYIHKDFKIVFTELDEFNFALKIKLYFNEKSLIFEGIQDEDRHELLYDFNIENSLFIISELDETIDDEKIKIKLSKNSDFDSFEIISDLKDFVDSESSLPLGIIFSKVD